MGVFDRAGKLESPYIQYVPGLSLQEEKKYFCLTSSRKTASSETPNSVIKISVLTHCILKLTCFVKIWTFYVIKDFLITEMGVSD
jgi:hypothetical protein